MTRFILELSQTEHDVKTTLFGRYYDAIKRRFSNVDQILS